MRQVLASLGAGNAAAIVVTLNDSEAAERIVREAKQAWPHVPVYARARDGEHARRLHAAGAALASPDALEAALQLGEALLNGVGVPDEAARRMGRRTLRVDLLKTENIGVKLLQNGPQRAQAALKILFMRGRPIEVFNVESGEAKFAHDNPKA